VCKDLPAGWHGVQRIVYLRRSGRRPSKNYCEDHYYICSYPFNKAQPLQQGIRGHWGIENRLHYVKDTHFNEDKNRIRYRPAAIMVSVFQDIAINLYRLNGYTSMKTATITYANKIKELFKFICKQY